MVRIAAGARDFSLFLNVQVGSEAHPAILQNGHRRHFSGAVKLAGHEADHTRPSGAEVNRWNYTSTAICSWRLRNLHFSSTVATARRTAILAEKLTVTPLLQKFPILQGIIKLNTKSTRTNNMAQCLRWCQTFRRKRSAQISNLLKIRPVGAELFYVYRQTDRQT